MIPNSDSKLFIRAALAVILSAGACLRFFQLGTPSLWRDELLARLPSSHSMACILDSCQLWRKDGKILF